ncbi:MAG: HNH endonuclease [Lutibacter sp.]|jgi:5-methylcytosine-specific restriction endonuclease McrA
MDWYKHSKRKKISPKLRNKITKRDGGICCECGKIANYCIWKDGYWHYYEIIVINKEEYHKSYEIDHTIPLCKNGNTDMDNMRLLCQNCNRLKGSKERRLEVV